MAGLLARLLGGIRKSTEGATLPGPYMLTDGWLPSGSAWNFWQMGQNVRPYTQSSAMVEGCISAYAQTIAMCPGDHWRSLENGGRERVASSALARFLRKPNAYQSISDFLLNLVSELYSTGNSYSLAIRNDRNEVVEMHLMQSRNCTVRVSEGGEIFYELGGNEVVDRMFGGTFGERLIVPARDVMHVRLHTPEHPLKGVSPIMAAALDLAASDAVLRQQIAYFLNQAKPSFVLSTDEHLTADQARDIRRAWDAQTKGDNSGGTPLLSWGLKPHKVGGTAQDAQLAETLKLSDQHVALAFRMPLQILGTADAGGTMGSTEALMNLWLASGLGFALNHVEVAMDRFFRLKGQPDEYTEFSTDVLLRSSFKDKVEGYARGVQAGIYAPNEGRRPFDLPDVEYGNDPRVQQQMVPFSFGAELQPPKPASTPAAPPPAEDEVQDDETKSFWAERSIDAERRINELLQ